MTVPNEEKLTRERRRTLFEDFYSGVTLHGFKQVCLETGFRKFLWYLICLASFALGCILFIGVTQDFYRYKTFVTTKVFDYENKDIDLPTITICNKVPLAAHGYERVKKIVNISKLEYEEFHLKYLTRYRFGTTNITPVERKIIDALHESNLTRYLDLLNLFEINEEDMFHDPVARIFLATGKGASDYPTCRLNYKYECETKATISWLESLCYQINQFEPGRRSKKGYTSSTGRYQNVIAVLNVGRTARFKTTHDVRTSAPYMDLIEGVVVYLHPFGTPHHNTQFIKRIFLRAGMWHFLKMDYTEATDLPAPYASKCGKKAYKVIKANHYPYSKSTCLIDCFLQLKMEKCGCVGWEFEDIVDLPMCNITQMKCYLASKGTLMKICKKKKDCPIECVQHKYSMSLQHHDIKHDSVTDRAIKLPGWKLNHSETEKYIQKNIIGIQIEFSSNAKVEEVVPAVTLNALVATIGGSIGLAMGFSVITLFEFLFFFYDYLTFTLRLWSQSRNNVANVITFQEHTNGHVGDDLQHVNNTEMNLKVINVKEFKTSHVADENTAAFKKIEDD